MVKEGKNGQPFFQNLHNTNGAEAPRRPTVFRCVKTFRSGNSSTKDEPRSGWRVKARKSPIQHQISNDASQSQCQIVANTGLHQSTISRHLRNLRKMNKVRKKGLFLPQELTAQNKQKRVEVCRLLLKRQEQQPFFKEIVTSDKKWVCYDNTKQKFFWFDKGCKAKSVPKPDLHGRKRLLRVWWDYRGVIHFELLPQGVSINSEFYVAQLKS